MRGNTRSQTFRKLLNSSAGFLVLHLKLSHFILPAWPEVFCSGSTPLRLRTFRLRQLHTVRRRRRVRISETNTPEHLPLSLSLHPSPSVCLSPSLSLSRSISLQTFGHFYARPLRTLDFVSLDFENLVESDPDGFLWACAGGEWSCRGTSCRCSENMWVLQHSCSTFLLFCSADASVRSALLPQPPRLFFLLRHLDVKHSVWALTSLISS